MLNYPVTVGLYLDTRRKLQDDTYPVKLRVTQRGRQRYYNTGQSCTLPDFEKIINVSSRINYNQGKVRTILFKIVGEAKETINDLAVFSFTQFQKALFDTSAKADLTVRKGFENYIIFLEDEGRIGSASTYQDTLRKLKSKGIYFEDITQQYLKEWEKQMYGRGLSPGSVGLHMRNLRRIYNIAKADRPILKDLYPFIGYKIPENENPKLALSAGELKQIFDYKPASEGEHRAIDYWKFLYLCNGMNFEDMLQLRWKDLLPDEIVFTRQKTKAATKHPKLIRVPRNEIINAIIKKYGMRTLIKNGFMFPHLKDAMTPKQKKTTVQGIRKITGKWMRIIAGKLKIDKPIHAQTARHSYASMLRRSGVATEMIMANLGHSDMKVTERYLDNFEKDKREEVAKNLLPWAN